MNVDIRTIAPIRVAYLRGTGPYPQRFPELGPRFAKLAGARGLFTETARTLSVCVDDPNTTPPEQIRGDAYVTVGDHVAGDDELKVQTIPGGTFAVATHVGPYRDLPTAWHVLLHEWIPQHGHRSRGTPGFEVYASDPRMTPEPELATEIDEPID
jgi:AraC family transcriptional regulator